MRYEKRTISHLWRLDNSRNGNPRYRVFFTDGSSAQTQSDAAFCYAINNPEMRGEIEVSFTLAGRIQDLRPA